MVTEAQVVNLGKAIQNDTFIMDIFTDHENHREILNDYEF